MKYCKCCDEPLHPEEEEAGDEFCLECTETVSKWRLEELSNSWREDGT